MRGRLSKTLLSISPLVVFLLVYLVFSMVAIILHLYYPFLMGICAILSILFERRTAR